jgi:WD40 repeat protein
MNNVIGRPGLVLIAVMLIAGCSPITPVPTEASLPSDTLAPSPVPPTGTLIPPTNTPAPTPTRTLAPPVETIRDIPYVPGGAIQQVLDLYLPPDATEPFPTVLLLHGGGGSKRDLASLATSLARQGYAAAALNFREYPRDTYPAAIQDAFCGLGWLYANAETYHLDPQRFFSLGHSFGGTLASMLGVVDDPTLFLAGCPYSLPETGRVRGVIAYTGLFDYVHLPSVGELNDYASNYLGSSRAAAPEIWTQASPLTWIDGSEPPFLIIHGEADRSIPIEQSQNFAAALQAAGVQTELMLVPDATHAGIVNSQMTLDAALSFLTSVQDMLPTQPAAALAPGEDAATPTPLPLTLLAELEGSTGPVYSLAWVPDGSCLASAGYGQVNLWDGESYTLLSTLQGHSSYVWSVAWAADGTRLASGGQDGSVQVWEPLSGAQIARYTTPFTLAVAWSPDGSQVAAGDSNGVVKIWDTSSGEQPQEMNSQTMSMIISLGWSPDGSTLAAGYLNGDIILWGVTTGARVLTITDYTRVRCDTNGLAWSPDGSQLATTHQDGLVRLWNAADGALLRELRGHSGWVRGVAWSPDGRWLATTGADGTLQVWQADSGVRLAVQRAGNLPLWSAAWSPDGSRIAVGSGIYNSRITAGVVVILGAP